MRREDLSKCCSLFRRFYREGGEGGGGGGGGVEGRGKTQGLAHWTKGRSLTEVIIFVWKSKQMHVAEKCSSSRAVIIIIIIIIDLFFT